MLSKTDILDCKDIESEVVKVPEWGGEVLVQGLTLAEKDEWTESIMSDGKANINESANAAAAAQRLIEQHRIEQAELQLDMEGDVESTDHLEKWELLEEDGPRIVMWRLNLALAIGRVNGCAGFYKDAQYEGDKASINIVGTKDNLKIVHYLFFYLSTTIERLCKKKGKGLGRVWAQSFRMGAVAKIKERLLEAQRKAREDLMANVKQSSTALVRLEGAIAKVDDQLKDAFAFLRETVNLGPGRQDNVTIDSNAYKRGQNAASKLLLDPRNKAKLHGGRKQLK